jgi:AAA domain
MTTANTSPVMSVQTLDDGVLVYAWDDEVVVTLDFTAADRRGHPRVKVTHQGTLVCTTHVDLVSLTDRERLQAHCHTVAPSITWLPRFILIADDLSTHDRHSQARMLVATPLSDIHPAPIEYLWKPYLPIGRPVGLIGDPGVGKSALVMKLAAHLTTGTAFPSLFDGVMPEDFPPRTVVMLTAEDDPADTLRPRLEVNGGDPTRLYHLVCKRPWTDATAMVSMQDLDLLTEALEKYRPALMVFDPLQSFLGPGVGMNNAEDTRPVLDALSSLCRHYACTPLYVRHIGKGMQEKVTSLGLGSIDITANCRSTLVLGYDPEAPTGPRRILAQSKSNTAVKVRSMAYVMRSVEQVFYPDTGPALVYEAPRLDWDGISSLTAEDLGGPPSREADEESRALGQAKDFLATLLGEGPQLAAEVFTAARDAGFSKRTIERARPLLDVQVRKRALEDTGYRTWPWEWSLSGNGTETR